MRRMLLIRQFEERLRSHYDYQGYFHQDAQGGEAARTAELLASTLYDVSISGKIGGAVHLCIGQEAVAVGVCGLLDDTDFVTSSHRDHGHFLAKGGDPRLVLAELMGRATGVSGGCGGSMHLYSTGHGFLGGNGIIGGQIPIALGPAFAARYRGDRALSVAFFGDGAANQGTLYESMNLAAIWRLPVIFVCENNLYAATTPAGITFPGPDIAPRAAGFHIPWAIVDGQELLAVREAAQEAIDRARRGDGPTFIEAKTYRFEGHCGTAGEHANPDECALWRQRDPIRVFGEALAQHGWLTAADQDQLGEQVRAELDEAERFALSSPYPGVEDLGRFEQ